MFLAIFINQQNARGADVAIGAGASWFGALWAAVWSAGYGYSPWLPVFAGPICL
ncbi:MAG: hypothetical protein AAFV59_05440 [Pseudomonadota bacterium]